MGFGVGLDDRTGTFYVTRDGRRVALRAFNSEAAALGYIDALQEAEALHRRREDRAVSCLWCGASLGLYVEGEAVPEFDHSCAAEACEREADSRLAREKETR